MYNKRINLLELEKLIFKFHSQLMFGSKMLWCHFYCFLERFRCCLNIPQPFLFNSAIVVWYWQCLNLHFNHKKSNLPIPCIPLTITHHSRHFPNIYTISKTQCIYLWRSWHAPMSFNGFSIYKFKLITRHSMTMQLKYSYAWLLWFVV